jgi:glycosyltransferase involved in cell wall biosynthesis
MPRCFAPKHSRVPDARPEDHLVRHDFLFSIIIPTYERQAQLAASLEALTRLEYPRDLFEVIVVDDGSKNPLSDCVALFRDKLNLTLLRQANAGPASARNRGATEAKGKFLAFTDDDCTPAHDWLRALADRFAAAPEHMIGGRSINALPENLYTTTSQLMTDAVYEYYNHDSGRQHFFTSNNLAVSAEMFRALGGFDITFPLPASEDREFCERWLDRGNQMTYASEAIVHHSHGLTLFGFFKHYFNYGRGALHFHGVRARAGREPLKVDPNFYRDLFTYPFRHLKGGRAVLIELMLVLAYVAYIGGFLWQKVTCPSHSRISVRARPL